MAWKVTLTWTDQAQWESGYKILRGVDGSPPVQIAVLPADSTSYEDTAVAPGHNYEYRVVPYTPTSENQTAVIEVYLPAPVESLLVQYLSDSEFRLSWGAVLGNQGYELELSTNDGPWIAEATLAQGATVYTDDDLPGQPEQKFRYRIRVKGTPNYISDWTFSDYAYSSPYAPSALSISFEASADTGASTARLTWLNNSQIAEGFHIYKEHIGAGGGFVLIGETAVPSFVDQDISPGISYRYYVRAYVGTTESPNSERAAFFWGEEELPLAVEWQRNVEYVLRLVEEFGMIAIWERGRRLPYCLREVLPLIETLDIFGALPVPEAEYVTPDYSAGRTPALVYGIQIAPTVYEETVYTKWPQLLRLLQSKGIFVLPGAWPSYNFNIWYSYLVECHIDLGSYEPGTLRPKLLQFFRALPVMHPAGKTAYVYIHAEDLRGSEAFRLKIWQLREELTGWDHFDDQPLDYFDKGEYFDAGRDPIHPSLQELLLTPYRRFDDGERFDEIGVLDHYYPSWLECNWEGEYFDDNDPAHSDWYRYFDQPGATFDDRTLVENNPVPVMPQQLEAEAKRAVTRFDQLVYSYHAVVELGRDVA